MFNGYYNIVDKWRHYIVCNNLQTPYIYNVYMLYKHATRVPTSQKDTLQACPFQKYTSGASVLLIIKTNEVSFYNDV